MVVSVLSIRMSWEMDWGEMQGLVSLGKAMQGADFGLVHTQRRMKPFLPLSTSPEVWRDLSSHWQLKMRLKGASPASFPSLDLSFAHSQPLWASVPQADPQTGSLDVWEISRAHILVLWDFFPSQQHGKGHQVQTSASHPVPSTATPCYLVYGLDTHTSVRIPCPCSHLCHNGSQDEGALWKASYHQCLKNKTNKSLFSAAVAWTELSPPGCSRMWLRYIREEQLSAWMCLKLAQREGFLHLFIYLLLKRSLLIRCKFSTKASSQYKGTANIFQLHWEEGHSALHLNFYLG